MDLSSVTSPEDLHRLEAAFPAGAIAGCGDMLYPDFRAREIGSLPMLLWAALVWTAGDLSLKDTAAAISAVGVTVSRASLHERFAKSSAWLGMLLSMLLCGNCTFPDEGCVRVLIGDSTSLSGPGATGTNFRVHALFDCATGALAAVKVTDFREGESCDKHRLGPESLVQYDRGYSVSKNLHAHAACGARFLIRCNPKGIRICDPQMRIVKTSRLESSVHTNTPLDIAVRIPARRRSAQGPRWHLARAVAFVDARLIGIRTPAGVMWLLTDMPCDSLDARAAGELYRRRWQIELLFKALKSVAGLDRVKSLSGATAMTWIYGKLILAALAQKRVPSFEPTSERSGEDPYRGSAFSRFRAAYLCVTHLVLGGVMFALTSHERHLRRLRNSPRKRRQQAPVMPIRISNHLPLIP
jgi:hypothetical protein